MLFALAGSQIFKAGASDYVCIVLLRETSRSSTLIPGYAKRKKYNLMKLKAPIFTYGGTPAYCSYSTG
jgi:hypothetical protein